MCVGVCVPILTLCSQTSKDAYGLDMINKIMHKLRTCSVVVIGYCQHMYVCVRTVQYVHVRAYVKC